MREDLKPDLCIIGAGSGGLSVAAVAAQLGVSVVLIEKGRMGGECLNSGCVPSKAMLAAGRAAHRHTESLQFGIQSNLPEVDFQAVHDHVHGVIAGIAVHDSVERFERLGVKVLKGTAQFISKKEVLVSGQTVRARRFIVATGSSAAVAPIPGINDTPHMTNETVFHLTKAPKHLIVIGGGPIGCELAQAHRQLGSLVTVIEARTILPQYDMQLVEVIRDTLLEQGIAIVEGATVLRTDKIEAGVAVSFEQQGVKAKLDGSHLLMAVGRQPAIDCLGLDEAGVRFSPQGIDVDAGLRTTNRRIYAIGDCTGGLQFTHVAGYQAGLVIRSALFRLPVTAKYASVPSVTYTDPELAQVGLTEAQALEKFGPSIRVVTLPFSKNDRALSERIKRGIIKAVITKNGRILGCGIAGPQAGELIQVWILALSKKLRIGDIAGMIAPYPTLGEVSKRVAGNYYAPSLFSNRTRSLVRFLSKFG